MLAKTVAKPSKMNYRRGMLRQLVSGINISKELTIQAHAGFPPMPPIFEIAAWKYPTFSSLLSGFWKTAHRQQTSKSTGHCGGREKESDSDSKL